MATLKESALGKINEEEAIEGSVNPKVKVYDCPTLVTSLEVNTILNKPSAFFVIVANPPGAVVAPVEVTVPTVVLGQVPGMTRQAGIVSVIVSDMK